MLLLDSNTATLLLYGRHARVLARFESVSEGERVAVTIITRIEILRGRFETVLKAGSKEEWVTAQGRLSDTERWLADFDVIPIDEAAADYFERLRVNKKLRKLGRADLLIACIALAHDATLITRNTEDFQHIPGVKLENWAS